MLDHLELQTEDLGRLSAFYEAVLVPLGHERMDLERARGFGAADAPALWLRDGVTSHAVHFAIRVADRAGVDHAYAVAVRAGGRAYKAPAVLEHVGPDYYAGFVHDPDGHLVEFVCRTSGMAVAA